ncbi:MAG: hypothetical protein CSA42_00070 [Gammaproteobacteria bacterium]|nr:MAG: hypothetical protein CSA42_00070 [Gammaproteobacteria bacterium]
MNSIKKVILYLVIFILFSEGCFASGITIGKNASFELNDGYFDLGCTDFVVESGGNADLGNGTISFCKKFTVKPGGNAILDDVNFFFCNENVLNPGIFFLLLTDEDR